MIIYHIVAADDWSRQSVSSTYEAASLHTEGFIHLSDKDQVAGVLERYYRGASDLLLLHVDTDKLTHELKYEIATNNESFPHLYGPLDKQAVCKVEPIV